MGYAPMRSMTAEMETGAIEGRYKQVVKDRGGFVETGTYENRRDLHDIYYGVHECDEKELPTGGRARTQAYRATPPADPWG
jgi:hypothetical protein